MTPPAAAIGRTNNSRGAVFTVLAMLGFASMDTITKWMVADYPIGQMMWVRYAIFCLFAWAVVRRRGLRECKGRVREARVPERDRQAREAVEPDARVVRPRRANGRDAVRAHAVDEDAAGGLPVYIFGHNER